MAWLLQSSAGAAALLIAAGLPAQSVPMSANPPAFVGEDIRIGSANAAGTGSYDATIEGETWDAGTYILGSGSVTVSANVGTFAGTPTPGSYTCGNRQVIVDANYIAVASQSEWATIASGASGSLDGKTVVVRAQSGITTLNNSGYSAFYQQTTECTLSGDGSFDIDTTTYHLGEVVINRTSKLTLHNLAIENLKCDAGAGGMSDFVARGCHFGNDTPNLNAEPVGGYFTGKNAPFWINGTDYIRGLAFIGCTFRGSGEFHATGSLLRYSKHLFLIGCHVTAYYGDGIKIEAKEADAPLIVGGNLWTNNFGIGDNVNYLPPDSLGPHSDPWQLYGFTDTTAAVFEACFQDVGGARGVSNTSVYVALAGAAFNGIVRACGSSDRGYNGVLASQLAGMDFWNIGAVPAADVTTGMSATRGRFNMNGTAEIVDCFGNFNDCNVTITASINTVAFSDAALDAALPNWNADLARATFAQALARFEPAPGGALDGKGPFPVITAGATQDGYLIDVSIAPIPNLSATSAAPSGSNGSGTATTDVAKGFIKWAIVPAGSGVTAADWESLLLEKLPGALEYDVTTAATATTHNFSGSATLSAGNYELLMMHFNGWSRRSSLVVETFTI